MSERRRRLDGQRDTWSSSRQIPGQHDSTNSTSLVLYTSDQNLANLAWAYGQAGYHHSGLFDIIAYQAVVKISSFRLHVLGEMCDGFRLSRHYHPDLVAAVASSLSHHVSTTLEKLNSEPFEATRVLSSERLMDVKGLVSIIAFLTQFGHDCTSALQVRRDMLCSMRGGFTMNHHECPKSVTQKSLLTPSCRSYTHIL